MNIQTAEAYAEKCENLSWCNSAWTTQVGQYKYAVNVEFDNQGTIARNKFVSVKALKAWMGEY